MAPKIDTKSKRDRLAVRREPYWSKVQAGCYIGFRRTSSGGTWIARLRGEDGKQNYQAMELAEHLACNEYDAAVQEGRKWFESLQAGVKPRENTVGIAAEDYLKDLGVRKGARAVADARGRLNRYILPNFKAKRLDKLTTAELRNWLNDFVQAGTKEAIRKSKASANRNLTTFKAVLNHAHKNGMCAASLAWDRVTPFGKVDGARKEFLSPEQVRTLISETSGGFRELVTSAAISGARYGELCALRAKDVDKESRVLNIREGKTGERIVPMTPDMAKHFSKLARGKLPEAYLLTRDDGKPWGHSDQDKLMRAAVKKAKLPREVVFYTLRHSFIAQAISVGLDIYSVAEITGTSIAMIERHYGKLLKGRVREAMTRASILSVA